MDDNCRKLWTAVLERAIEDALRGGKYWIHRENARFWFLSENHELGSFLWICDTVNLDPSLLRKFVLRKSNAEKYPPQPARKLPNHKENGRRAAPWLPLEPDDSSFAAG